jgi:hypothetical protein
MREIAARARRARRKVDQSIAEETLREHYEQRRRHYGIGAADV